MENLVDVIGVISDIGGPVAVFGFAWALFKFKDMEKRLQKMESVIDAKMKKIDDINKDVSYIRGWIEGIHNKENNS